MGELATRMRQKFPGAYDDMDDATLEAKIVSKYPEYSDLAGKTETPVEKKKTAGWTDALRAVGRGLYGTAIGAGQLVNEAANKLTLGTSPALKENAEALRRAEAERRQWGAEHAAEFEGSGVTNPINRLEFMGGLLMPGASTGGLAGKATLGLSRVAPYAKAGLASGAVAGAAAPLVEDESRLVSTGLGAVGGVIAGPALGVAAEYVPKVAKAVVGGTTRKVKDAITNKLEASVYPELQTINEGTKGAMKKMLNKFAPPKPSEIQSVNSRIRHYANDMAAGDELVKLRNEIELPDEAGNLVKGRLPQNLEQTVDATNQGMNKIGEWIDNTIQASGGSRVSLAQPIAELSNVTPQNGWAPDRVAQAQRLIAEFKAIEDEGGYNFAAAVKRMSALNNDAKAVFAGKNVSGDAPEILALAGNNLRSALNTAAENVSPQFGELRKAWGQLSGLNQRALAQFEKTLAGKALGGFNVFETLGAQQMLQAAVGGRIDKLVQAGGSLATGTGLRMFKSPDRAAKKFFQLAAQQNKGAIRNPPEITPRSPVPELDYGNNPEVLPKRWVGEMGIPGNEGKLGLEEGGIPAMPPKMSGDTGYGVETGKLSKPTGNRATAGPLNLDSATKAQALDALDKVQRGKTEVVRRKNYKILEDLADAAQFASVDEMLTFLMKR